MDNQATHELPDLTDDTICDENFIVEMDSYFDDINSRLTVSRMVSDSVMKGIVSAVTREAAEIVASKTEELDTLRKKLRDYESVNAKENGLYSPAKSSGTPLVLVDHMISGFPYISDDSSDHICRVQVNKLKVAAEEHLKTLKMEVHRVMSEFCMNSMSTFPTDLNSSNISGQENVPEKFNVINECADALEDIVVSLCQKSEDTCSLLKMLLSKQQFEHNLQKEITASVVQNLILDARGKFGENTGEEVAALNSFNKNCQKAIESLASMRQELEAFSTFIFNSETGLAVSHHNFESLEESCEHKKHHAQPKVLSNHHLPQTLLHEEKGDTSIDRQMEFPLLKSMPKDELLSYFKAEMTKMKREHDLALQEKTEELFTLKRELLKEKGCSPLNFKREKEHEILKKKIIAHISMLEHIVSENKKLWAARNKQVMLLNSKQRSESDHVIVENQFNHSLITDSISKNSRTAEQQYLSEFEESISEHKKKLMMDVEDLHIEAEIIGEIQKTVLSSLLVELQIKVEGLGLETKTVNEILLIIYGEYVQNTISRINPLTEKLNEEKNSAVALLLEKEKELLLEMEENKRLKDDIEILSTLRKEKDIVLSVAELKFMEQKKKYDTLCYEQEMLKGQLRGQTLLISGNEREYHMVKSKLDETLQKIHRYEMQLREMNVNLKMASDALAEADKQKGLLHGLLEEKHKEILSALEREEEYATCMKSVTNRIEELADAMTLFEDSTTIRLESNASRLKLVCYQTNELAKMANAVQRKASWNKQAFERRCADLQNAESEVDLLGDEVETLLRLLEKIHVALEHYSPVLQYYTGIMEILKLIRQELKRRTNN